MHICTTKEVGAIYEETYLRHQAMMSWMCDTKMKYLLTNIIFLDGKAIVSHAMYVNAKI